MAGSDPQEVTLETVHSDLTELRGELREVKGTLVAGFRGLPARESAEEMIRLLREGNRLQEDRFARMDATIREQHLEIQQVLRAVAEGQRLIVESQGVLVEGQRVMAAEIRSLSAEIRSLSAELRSLSADIKDLIARLDALIKGRGDGHPAP